MFDSYSLGQPVRVDTEIRDVNGTLVNAASIAVKVRRPDATDQNYSSPVNDGPGLYHQDIPAADLTQIGAYQYAWTTTGVGAGVSGPDPKMFYVFDPLTAPPPVTRPVVFPPEFAAYLGVAVVNKTRAEIVLRQAQTLCESIVTPLPTGAETVILDVATRAWPIIANAAQGAGPYNDESGTVGTGLWLTRQNKSTLRRLAGGGGAFTFDTMPATAGQGLPWWDVNTGPVPGDWDIPA